MVRVFASLPHLSFTPKGESTKEIYVLSFATHAGSESLKEEDNVFSANNEPLPLLIPSLANHDLLDQVFVGVSNTFYRVSSEYPVSLSGDGIVLYPPNDPGDLFGLYFVVVESDSKKRAIGKRLQSIFEDDLVKDAKSTIANVSPAKGVGLLMRAITTVVPKIFRGSKDDIYFTHSHSGFAFNNYGIGSAQDSVDFALQNDRVNCTLRLSAISK